MYALNEDLERGMFGCFFSFCVCFVGGVGFVWSFVNANESVDPPLIGREFTWTYNQDRPIMCILNHLSQTNWNATWQSCNVLYPD